MARTRIGWAAVAWFGLAIAFAVLAWCRPVDHDESQYVAAALLTAHGLLPYRDYPYLQTPLQPLLLAPVAWAAGTAAWPALRFANALLGWVAVRLTWAAARGAGAARGPALAAAGLFATTDVLLFSIGTARNDALPAALLAGALAVAVRPPSRGRAALAGLLLAAAVAAKVSYLLPAIGYAGWALAARERRAPWAAAGAVPIVLLVGWTWWLSPAGFVFGTLWFPHAAPTQYYRAIGQAARLGIAAKLVDTVQFLALGPALLALIVVSRRAPRPLGLPEMLVLAGLAAALLPTPTWRQYLLPVLPPLFAALGIAWTRRPPRRPERVAAAVFAGIGLAPSLLGAASDNGMAHAIRDGRAIRAAMDRLRVTGPIATLSPQYLAATGRLPDPRYATGPFYFRSKGLVPPAAEPPLRLVSWSTQAGQPLPPAVLAGGEGAQTGGAGTLDPLLEVRAAALGYRRTRIAGGYRLWTRNAPPASRASISP